MFQRRDIHEVRIQVERGDETIVLAVSARGSTFFYDVDIAIATLEVHGRDIALQDAVEIMDRFGRPYAPAWEDSGRGAHCLYRVEFWGGGKTEGWRAAAFVGGRLRRPREISPNWSGIAPDHTVVALGVFLSPMVPGYLPGGTLKYHQIENKRIPIMTYLSFDNPLELTRGDMVRIGSAAKWGHPTRCPTQEKFLESFETDHCYDRYWDPDSEDMHTRFMFVGVAFAGVSSHQEAAVRLAQFRHQFFQIALIANFHKAALLSLSDRFSRAVERLNVRDFESVKEFRSTCARRWKCSCASITATGFTSCPTRQASDFSSGYRTRWDLTSSTPRCAKRRTTSTSTWIRIVRESRPTTRCA